LTPTSAPSEHETWGRFKAAETNLERALARAGDCQAAYRDATDRMRRQFNMAFFKRLIISDEGTVSGELAERLDVILGEELRRAAAVREAESLKEAIEQAERNKRQHPREPELALVGATAAAPRSGDGWSPNILVRSRVRRPNLDSLFEDLMEPVARQARRGAAEAIKEAA
jgi:hypothetical protein